MFNHTLQAAIGKGDSQKVTMKNLQIRQTSHFLMYIVSCTHVRAHSVYQLFITRFPMIECFCWWLGYLSCQFCCYFTGYCFKLLSSIPTSCLFCYDHSCSLKQFYWCLFITLFFYTMMSFWDIESKLTPKNELKVSNDCIYSSTVDPH